MKQKLIEGRNIAELNTRISNENALGWKVVCVTKAEQTIICLLEKQEEK